MDIGCLYITAAILISETFRIRPG